MRTNVNETSLVVKNPEQEVQDTIKETQLALRNAPEVQLIAKNVNVENEQSILEFGNETAIQISTAADKVMSIMNPSIALESGVMMKELTKIMKKVDRGEIQKTDEGFFGKLFSNGKKTIEKLMAKYESIGSEILTVNNEIKKYELELKQTNGNLKDMIDESFQYYTELEKYIVAGQIVIEEMTQEDIPYFVDKAQSGQQIDIMNLDNVRNTIKRMETRIAELEMAKMVALQGAIQMRMIQNGNYELIQTINSAFIVTIPALKNGMINAIAAKQQELVANSMDDLKKATNQFLIKNAQNVANQSVKIAQLSGAPLIEEQTIDTMWTTIMNGIEQTAQIEENNKKLRQSGVQKVHQLQNDMQQKRLSLN